MMIYSVSFLLFMMSYIVLRARHSKPPVTLLAHWSESAAQPPLVRVSERFSPFDTGCSPHTGDK